MNPFEPASPEQAAAQPRSTSAHGARMATRRLPQWALPASLAGLALAVLAGCGGGSGGGTGGDTSSTPVASTPTATAAAYTEGTLSGFGSIIVNGVRFDDSAATVTDDNGGLRTTSSLKLGMRVSVDSSSVDSSTSTARASAVRFGSELVGPVSSVSTSASTLVVLGQTVDVTSTTVFDDSLAAGLSAVASGAVVEVHGVPDATTGHIVASRIESASTATSYKLRGTVASLDTTAKTFSIGAANISYAAVTTVPSTLANGVSMRVVLATAPVAGVWQATALGSTARKLADSTEAHLRGTITAFTSTTSFTVGTQVVDASKASFPDGSTGVVLGAAVEVEGTVTNGVLVATKVEIDSKHSGEDSRKFELNGSITSVDATAKTFVVRGVTVNYAGTVTYTNGTAANLVVGAKVKVIGGVGSTRTQVLATSIRFDT